VVIAVFKEGTTMTKFVSLLAIIAFAVAASPVEAAKKKPQETAASSGPGQASAPVQNRARPRGGTMAGCKMSGRC
jgi:hypothetical protein